MPRAIEFEVTVDTSTFSAVQLQPHVAAALTWNALARWLRTYMVSLPKLIGEHSTGLVALGFHLHYQAQLPRFDCDALRVRAAFQLKRRGERGQLDLRISSSDRHLATARLIVCPVAIEDPISLGARPAPLPSHLQEKLAPDEVDSTGPARPVPDRLAALETSGRLLAEGRKAFTIHRHRTEVADQWSWTEVPALVESARELIALRKEPELRRVMRRCLASPLTRFDVEFGRPMFAFERGAIVSRAYAIGEGLGLVHRLTSTRGTALHATAVEVYQ